MVCLKINCLLCALWRENPWRCCPSQVRCLVDVPGEKLPQDLPAYLRATVAPQLPPELQKAFLAAIDAAPVRSMQNKQLSCQPLHQPGG